MSDTDIGCIKCYYCPHSYFKSLNVLGCRAIKETGLCVDEMREIIERRDLIRQIALLIKQHNT